MRRFIRVWTCCCLFVAGCGKPESPAPASAVADAVPLGSKRLYRCEWSPLIDYEAKNFEEILTGRKGWRVAADGISYDAKAYDDLEDPIEKIPAGSDEGLPFSGLNELSDFLKQAFEATLAVATAGQQFRP